MQTRRLTLSRFVQTTLSLSLLAATALLATSPAVAQGKLVM